MNLSTTLSDSLDISEDETKELVNKCNTTDKTQYTIAFDSNDSRYGTNMVNSLNCGYLTSSIYNCFKNRVKMGENGNTESPNDTTATTVTTESDDTLSYHTLSNNSPHSTLATQSLGKEKEKSGSFLPIYDLQASSTSPDVNHIQNKCTSKYYHGHANECPVSQCSNLEQGKCIHYNTHPVIKSSSKSSCESFLPNSNYNPPCQQQQGHTVTYMRPTVPGITAGCPLLLGHSHELLQQPTLQLPSHLAHLHEHRLKHASPIREEDEPSTDSSRADVEMISDSEKGTPSSTSDSSPLTAHGRSNTFNATTNSRSGPWSSAQIGSESSSGPANGNYNESNVNRNCNLRSSAGYSSVNTRHHIINPLHGDSRQNMAEWLKKTSMMSTPRGYYRQGGSEPPTPMNPSYQMCPGFAGPGGGGVNTGNYTSGIGSSTSTSNTCMSHRHHCTPVTGCCHGHLNDHHYHQHAGSEQVSPTKDTIYVCYPNYSLPDLSFLNEAKASTPLADVCLSPTKPFVRSPTANTSKVVSSTSSTSTVKGGSKTRPKSFNDVDTLTKSTLERVKDWDSLSFLLPPDFKAILGAKGLVPDRSKGSNGPPCKGKFSDSSVKLNPLATIAQTHQVKMRPQSTAGGPKSKRYSLQEPLEQVSNANANYNYNNSTKCRGNLTRSETLPQHSSHCSGHTLNHHCPCGFTPGHNVASNCCHHYTPCCHRRGFTPCCDSPYHQQQLINREDSIETLKDLLAMQDAVNKVGQLLETLSPSLEVGFSQALVKEKDYDKDKEKGDISPSFGHSYTKNRTTSTPKTLLRSPGEKPSLPPKPMAIGASPAKFKSLIPVPKTPGPKSPANPTKPPISTAKTPVKSSTSATSKPKTLTRLTSK